MSDLLEKFARAVEEKQSGGWHGEESIPVRLSEEEIREAITALQALRDLETLFEGKNRYTEIRKQNLNDSNCFSVQVGPQIKFGGYQDTIPAALRAAVEAIKKGETE